MTIKGSCHCGKTRFEIERAPSSVTACTCSYCSKSGALWAYFDPMQFQLLTPEANRALYLWNSKTVQHYFCDTCGCSTYGVSPEWVDMKPDFSKMKYAVNARLLDDFDLDAVPVTVIDGKTQW